MDGIKCDIKQCYDRLKISKVLKVVKNEIFNFATNDSQFDGGSVYFRFKIAKKVAQSGLLRSVPYDWEFMATRPKDEADWTMIPLKNLITWLNEIQHCRVMLNKKEIGS
jgi:hypothetical protein